VNILGADVATRQSEVRTQIGVVFQSPSLDRMLTVSENLKHQGHLYGLRGSELRQRIELLLERLGIANRARDRIASLSGGLQRRVEIAKGLLHRPRLLLLDEPSTGLDPGARDDLWRYLQDLRDSDGVTAVVTTHLMEEAEHCDRLAILDQGRLVATGPPAELRAHVGGDCITITSATPAALAETIAARFDLDATVVGGNVRIERTGGHELVRELVEAFPAEINTITLGKPTLQDAFIHLTGHQFWAKENA
jgi:ABC-2 type transport system ATP-binding protein